MSKAKKYTKKRTKTLSELLKLYNITNDVPEFGIGGQIGAGIAGVAKGVAGSVLPGPLGGLAVQGIGAIHGAIDNDITDEERSIMGYGQAAGAAGSSIATGGATLPQSIATGAAGLGEGIAAGSADNAAMQNIGSAVSIGGQIGGMVAGNAGAGDTPVAEGANAIGGTAGTAGSVSKGFQAGLSNADVPTKAGSFGANTGTDFGGGTSPFPVVNPMGNDIARRGVRPMTNGLGTATAGIGDEDRRGFADGGSIDPMMMQQMQQQQGMHQMPDGSMMPDSEMQQQGGATERTGGNLAEFNGPSHAEGGIPFNGNAEIEKQETVDQDKQFVYSDKLIVPGSKKTFAEESTKYKDTGKEDNITNNTNELMLDRLKGQQETLKQEMAQKAMIKIQKQQNKFMAEHGGYIPQMTLGAADPMEGVVDNMENGGYLPYGNTRVGTTYGGPAKYPDGGIFGNKKNISFGQGQAPRSLDSYGTPAFNTPSGNIAMPESSGFDSTPYAFGNNVDSSFGQGAPARGIDSYGEDLYTTAPEGNFATEGQSDVGPRAKGQGIGNTGITTQGLMQAAPAVGALVKGLSPIDKAALISNPEYAKSIGLMQGRKYNVDPEISAARAGQYNAGRNAANATGGNAAKALAMGRAATVNYNQAEAAALARKQNVDNQYIAQEAQHRGQMGSEAARYKAKQQELDMRAEGKKGEYFDKALDYAGKFGNLNQTNDIYKQLVDANYGNLPEMAKIAGIQTAENKRAERKANKAANKKRRVAKNKNNKTK